jgi:S-adenosylmethionine hydrolase
MARKYCKLVLENGKFNPDVGILDRYGNVIKRIKEIITREDLEEAFETGQREFLEAMEALAFKVSEKEDVAPV